MDQAASSVGDFQDGGTKPQEHAWNPGWVQHLLGVPLFHKIVLANVVLVGGLGATAMVLFPGPEWNGARPMVAWAFGVLVVISVNGILVHLALRPLRDMEEIVHRVEKGDTGARVPVSPLADRDLRRIAGLLNRMLRTMDSARALRRELSARILELAEAERKQIASELFDDTAQNLSAALIHLQLASHRLARQEERDVDPAHLLGEAREDVLHALSGIQRIARGLRPPELDELGPMAALEMHARKLTEGTGIQVTFQGNTRNLSLPTEARLAVYRIFQEAMMNAVVHGNPSRMSFTVTAEAEQVEIRMEDDGVGFEPEQVRTTPAGHLGILWMQERARFVNARLHIESGPDEGTLVALTLPVPAASPSTPETARSPR